MTDENIAQITLIKCEDGAIWVTSDQDPNGTESTFNKITDWRAQMMIALANFLGYESANILCFDERFEDE